MDVRLQKRAITGYKIFIIGLILQFFAHTFVTYRLGISDAWFMGVLWSRKEIVVILWSLVACWIIWKDRPWSPVMPDARRHTWVAHRQIMRYMTLVWLALMIYAFADTVLRGLGIIWFLKAWKYDLIGYMILITTYYINTRLTTKQLESVIDRSISIIKPLLVWAMVWYMILIMKPWALKLFGYDRAIIEGDIGQRPPAVYWTREFEGFPRNQFLFERPISRWFFLIAFFPLFFVRFLQRKSVKKTWFRWLMFSGNIILTYSRAARGSWIIELAILGFLTYKKRIRFFIRKLLLPALIVFIGIAWIAKDQVINRQFSNTGHIQLLVQWWHYFTENPLFGKGAGSVWPASHRAGGSNFNPENQFLQIAIEFGIIGFILRMIIYARLHLIGLHTVVRNWRIKQLTPSQRYTIALSIGMLWLSISWLVLHSFTDRMIVYPFMVVAWCILALQLRGSTSSK